MKVLRIIDYFVFPISAVLIVVAIITDSGLLLKLYMGIVVVYYIVIHFVFMIVDLIIRQRLKKVKK